MAPERPKTVEELALWAAEHDGRVNALWDNQHSLNDLMEKRLYAISTRLGALERKVMWFAGFAACAGGLIGGVLPKLLA